MPERALRGRVRRLFQLVDEGWSNRLATGLSSGEGLIWRVRDPIVKVSEGEEVGVDYGVDDKRLVVFEGEFASTFRVLGRDGNTLSSVLRNVWENGDLSILTKNSPATTTGALISICSHVTVDELLRYLNATETANGFANRFLWVCVKRSKFLPDGGNLEESDVHRLASDLRTTIEFASTCDRVDRDQGAKTLWHEVYPLLSEGTPGLLGSLTARAEAQVTRLALLYALLDCSPVIRSEHLRAALALWDYAASSVDHIFGDTTGNPDADRILTKLKTAPQGLTRTDIHKHLGHHLTRNKLDAALAQLQAQSLAHSQRDETSGRTAERWFHGPADEAIEAKEAGGGR